MPLNGGTCHMMEALIDDKINRRYIIWKGVEIHDI